MENSPLIQRWEASLKAASASVSSSHPSYFAEDPRTLISSSEITSFQTSTGDDIFTSVLPSLEAARSEILFVTCFWARSSSLKRLAASLCELSDRVVRNGEPRVRVRIGLSSLSLFQKLFQTASIAGRDYSQGEWVSKLGLPPADRLPGIDLAVKSVFVRPFSVMHPKFVIIDRAHVWLPSCNVSWEAWFEGCVGLRGPIVMQFVRFWEVFWQSVTHTGTPPEQLSTASLESLVESSSEYVPGSARTHLSFNSLGWNTFSLFLPSPHHINPRFRPFPWQKAAPPTPTPLNMFILSLLASARRSIYMQTPNLTSPPVLSALLAALKRGVRVHIVTSERLMILEQLVTAGTTGARCVKQLIRRYQRHIRNAEKAVNGGREHADLEAQTTITAPGELKVEFYQPAGSHQGSEGTGSNGEPVQSHLKLTAVDDEWLVLGSGNMDRASWYTSQELGVALYNGEIAVRVLDCLERALVGRKKAVLL